MLPKFKIFIIAFYLCWILSITVSDVFALTPTIHSVQAGGLWGNAATWVENRIPQETDIPEINGTVTINNNINVAGLTVSAGAILMNSLSSVTLTINGDAVNNGTIAYYSSYYLLNINISGNITNNGSWKNYKTNLIGTQARTISGNAIQSEIGLNDNFEIENSPTFGGVLSCNGKLLSLSEGQSVTLLASNSTGLNIDAENVTFGGSYQSISGTITATEVILGGTGTKYFFTTTINGNLTINNDITLMNSSSSTATVTVNGNIVNNGTTTYYSYYYVLYINVTGNIANNGIWANYKTYLIGTQARTISGNPITGDIALNDNFEIENSPTFGGVLSCNGKLLSLSEGQSVTLLAATATGLNIDAENVTFGGSNQTISGTITATEVILGGTGTKYFFTTNINGNLTIKHGITMINSSSSSATVTIEGDVVNNGTIAYYSNSYHLYMNIAGNITNNGVWKNYKTTLTGNKPKKITGKPIQSEIVRKDNQEIAKSSVFMGFEDNTISNITLPVTCTGLNIVLESSDITLVSLSNISYVCTTDALYMSITPSTNDSGSATITVTSKDGNTIVSRQSFVLILTPVNDMPDILSVSNKTMNENTSLSFPITLTDMDNNSLTVYGQVSDLSMIRDNRIIFSGENIISSNGDRYSITTNSSGSVELTVTLNPVDYKYGSCAIDIVATDGIDSVNKTFVLNIEPVRNTLLGHVTYYNNNLAVPDVIISLDSNNYTTSTSAFGEYTLSDIIPGNYTANASKTTHLAGLSSTDVSRIARHVTGVYTLNCYEKLAADVTQDGYVTSTDASRVARYSIGLRSSLNNNNINWKFIADSISSCSSQPFYYSSSVAYLPLNSGRTNQDYNAIRLGDVTGDWQSESQTQTQSGRSMPKSIAIKATPDENLSIPILLYNESIVEGIDISMEYDPDIVRIINVTLKGTVAEQKGYVLISNLSLKGKLSGIIYTDKQPDKLSGVIGYVNLEIIGELNKKTALIFSKFNCNEQPQNSSGFFIKDTIARQMQIIVADKSTIDAKEIYDANRNNILDMADVFYFMNAQCQDTDSQNKAYLSSTITILKILSGDLNDFSKDN